MLIRIVMVVLALVSASVVAPAAQQPAEPRDWPAWLDAVTSHTPGERDAAVQRLSQWTRADLDRILPAVSRLAPEERTRVVSRALVLHTDVALFSRTTMGYDLPAGDGLILLFADGKEVGQMVRTFHWDFGRRLIDRLPRGDVRTSIARPYYRAAAGVLQLWAEDGELQAHFAAAARVLGNDPVLLMYEGTMHQADADPRSQRYFDELRRAGRDRLAPQLRPNTVPPMPPTIERSRADAERLFRRALAADPSLAEARVRLAHILHDRGRHDDAARQLDELEMPSSATPFLHYYTAMLTGRVARALERIDASQASFERAVALQPLAQAPRLALSELAMARGDRNTAMRYLMPLSAATGNEDLWWRIGRTHGHSAWALVEEMGRVLR